MEEGAAASPTPRVTVKVKGHRHFKAHKGHVVSLQFNAQRIITGSRDKTAFVQDFWAKMVDNAKRRQEKALAAKTGRKTSRFLR